MVIGIAFFFNGGVLLTHASYGISAERQKNMDEVLMEFIKENVPIDAKLETDPNMLGNMGLGWRKSKYDAMQGYCFNYERGDAHLQMVILDYEAEDRVYRADQLWVNISNVAVIDVSAKMYAYEDGEWTYIENIELDPYLQKKSYVRDGSRLLVSGEQWENNYPKTVTIIPFG